MNRKLKTFRDGGITQGREEKWMHTGVPLNVCDLLAISCGPTIRTDNSE